MREDQSLAISYKSSHFDKIIEVKDLNKKIQSFLHYINIDKSGYDKKNLMEAANKLQTK